jgi:activator of HSP90 ATPase
MNPSLITRRTFSRRAATLLAGAGVAGAAFRIMRNANAAAPAAELGLSSGAEAIHQERIFKADRKRIYQTLLDTARFDKISAEVRAGMPPGAPPTRISAEVGGDFLIFGGYILGRQIELVPDRRIVQVWRTVNWPPGVYSIAKYELTELGSGTRLVFDHTGFPQGEGEHLAAGWIAHYWEPLEKFLA